MMVLEEKIIDLLNNKSEMAVFSTTDFIEIGNSESIRQTLNRMTKKDLIKKIIPGFYYRPRYSELLKEYEAVSPHQFALAMARKYNWNIAPSGVTALNLLGLSQQVPVKWCYISDGCYKKVQLGNRTIEFKKKNNREITGMSYKTAMVIQAIKELGKEGIDNKSIARIRESLTKKEMKILLEESKSSLVWIYDIIKNIAKSETNG